MQGKSKPTVIRSEASINWMQLRAAQATAELAVQLQLSSISPAILGWMIELQSRLKRCITGPAMDKFPLIEASDDPTTVLMKLHTLAATAECFVQPDAFLDEEREALAHRNRGNIGFHLAAQGA